MKIRQMFIRFVHHETRMLHKEEIRLHRVEALFNVVILSAVATGIHAVEQYFAGFLAVVYLGLFFAYKDEEEEEKEKKSHGNILNHNA